MDLSIVIVNYNVRELLEQTILSVYKAINGLQAEVIVVDNNSVDGSVAMVKERFTDAIVIANTENYGFSKANNQAINISKGKYILLLNPDTVVREDTFVKTVAFMDAHPEAGGLGVHMIDGRGKFLPESKRGLPTPQVAFYKMAGLSKLFPKSKLFGQYHLGFLPEKETNEVDVLSGAFMMLRRETLDKTGLLDETFFMYGEDIDLSYRIKKAGYKNYYFADTTIIHYKGESTKKHSVNYVKVFYKAMVIFAEKHYKSGNAKVFSILINSAIYLRAALALVVRFFKSAWLFFVDFAVLFAGMYGLKLYWEHYNRFIIGGTYPTIYMQYHVPAYILFWLGGMYLAGGYRKPASIKHISRGIALGSIALLAVYALLPETMRFSRALIMLGSVWALLSTIITRILFHAIKYKNINVGEKPAESIVIVGSEEECRRAQTILNANPGRFTVTGFVSPAKEIIGPVFLGNITQINDITDIYKIGEIIFCAKDISAEDIMHCMCNVDKEDLKYKILPEKSSFIIGSNSKNTNGELYSLNWHFNLQEASSQKHKRVFDCLSCLMLLPLLPFLLFKKTKVPFFKSWTDVLKGNKTWIGYNEEASDQTLPKIKSGVFNTADEFPKRELDTTTLKNLNLLYARNYTATKDRIILMKVIFGKSFK
ncbi:MAG: glycosyltransferase [Bacteroidia bacterium]|nr:glycosyltransferase [Bacteroidia bacterium]